MNKNDRLFFKIRTSTDEHSRSIVTLRQKPQREYDNLIAQIFTHQTAVYDYLRQKNGFKIELANYFYSECYIIPNIKLGLGGINTKIKEFIDEVILDKGIENRNSLYYLLGDLGVGKTAFINYLISKYFKQLVETKQIWFIRIDFERLGIGKKELTLPDFIYNLSLKTRRIIEENPILINDCDPAKDSQKKLIESLNLVNKHSDKSNNLEEVFDAFTSLIHQINKHAKRRLIIILDNIDYLCHLRDRTLFDQNTNTQEAPFLIKVCDFIELFLHEQPLGHISANVIFVIRKDSYEILSQVKNHSLPVLTTLDNKDAFTIFAPSLEEVLDARGKLITFASEKQSIEGKRTQFKNMTNLIKTHLSAGSPKLVTHLERICNSGLREMMHFFAQYGWVTDNGEGEEKTIERFIHQYPVGLLTFMLEKKLRFHQYRSHFPNIYLINKMPIRENDTTYEHPHSYWLKRLLCHFIDQADNITPTNIMDIFHGIKKDGYEENLIRYCLNDLADANCSNVIRAKRERHQHADPNILHIVNIDLTERGKHCLDQIFDRFFYLQLIVDDYHLPIPNCIFDEYLFNESYNDYSYVIEPPHIYSESAKKMITLKAKQVLLFLEILEISYNYESIIWEPVFLRLEEERIKLPDIKKIKEGILSELSKINKNQKSFMNIDELLHYAGKFRKSLESTLANAYSANEQTKNKS